MKGKSLIAVVVVVLLLLGLGGYFVMSNKGSLKSQTGSMVSGGQEEVSNSEPESKQNSLKGLFMAGIPQTCTYKTDTERSSNEGTIYIAKGKMRGDFDAMVDGKEMKSHMIVDNDTSYIWTDGETKGYKTTFTANENAEVEAPATNAPEPTGGVDLDSMADYNCKPWLADGAFFQLPEGVEFVSLEDMMQNVQGQTGSQCAVCDELEGDSKTQCLTALKCN